MEYLKFKDINIGLISEVSGKMCEVKCYLCGQYFKTGEKAVCVVVPYNYKKSLELKRLGKHNYFFHLDELQNLINSSDTLEELFLALEHAKRPRTVPLTEEQTKKLKAFIETAYNLGYRKEISSKKGIAKCKKNGTSDTVSYNVYSDIIEADNRRKGYMFDSLVERQIIANVYNEFHKILADGKKDDYNALQTFSNIVTSAIETTNEIMGK